MIIGNKTFDTKHHGYIMGILNVTPDSFSDGGKYDHLDAALKHADEMIRDGAAIIDVGGESTRPGYTLISDEEEIARVTPVIEALKKEFDVPVSLDTYKSGVAKAGIEAGADLINDIWGLKWDGTMAAVLAETGVASCLMHNRKDTDYKDYLNDVVADLDETMKMAKEAGIKKETIMLDPGIGFAKDLDQNLELMNHLQLLNQWDVPVLLGTSRKSMIGLTLDLPSDQRVEGTVATTVSGYMKGCRFFRVHDVKENMRAMKMIEAICAKQGEQMMDQITIKDLEVYANHGLYKEEKALGQKFLVSAILSLDTKLAGVSDQMDYSVDYGKVCHRIKEILTKNDFNLIECVAETVAKKLLLEFSLIRKLEIEVKKPWAPIGLPLDYVSVKIKRGWHRAYLGVGSNMGDRMEYINQAINAIEAQDDTRVVHVSSLIETKPYGGVVQDDFLNGCIAIDTLKEPEELLDFLMDVEAQAGRVRTIHWGPRTLDLDILMYDDRVMNERRLTIPHKEMHKRLFVLEPLEEIAPYLMHPLLGQTITQLKEKIKEEQ